MAVYNYYIKRGKYQTQFGRIIMSKRPFDEQNGRCWISRKKHIFHPTVDGNQQSACLYVAGPRTEFMAF